MPTDFSSVVKYLDYNKSRKVTDAEADAAKPQPVKRLYYKSRPIQKIHYTFNLLRHVIPFSTVDFYGQLMFQYNLTFVGSLFITKLINRKSPTISLLKVVKGGCLTIKYRVGSEVFRYALVGSQKADTQDVMSFPVYNGEIIQENCVFEFWANFNSDVPYDPIGVDQDIIIETSRLVNPSTPDETEHSLFDVEATDRADFAVALPETLPYTQDTQVWLDNT